MLSNVRNRTTSQMSGTTVYIWNYSNLYNDDLEIVIHLVSTIKDLIADNTLSKRCRLYSIATRTLFVRSVYDESAQ